MSEVTTSPLRKSADSSVLVAVAVHNAGGNEPAPFLEVTEKSFTRHWREHVLGGFQVAQAALPLLLQNGGGSLFFTGASASLRGKARFAPFASAKAAVRNLAQIWYLYHQQRSAWTLELDLRPWKESF